MDENEGCLHCALMQALHDWAGDRDISVDEILQNLGEAAGQVMAGSNLHPDPETIHHALQTLVSAASDSYSTYREDGDPYQRAEHETIQ